MTLVKAVTIEATYRIVTPMFCSGAERLQPELRPASFKGLMRFWWRAAEWGRFAAANNPQSALEQMRNAEDALFGSTRTGLSRFSLVVRWQNEPAQSSEYVRDWPANRGPGGSTYLGYGITESGEKPDGEKPQVNESGKKRKGNFKPHREGWPSGQMFEAIVRMSRFAGDEDRKSIERTLKIMGALGGLGSRTRRGFGSLSLESLNAESVMPTSTDSIKRTLRANIAPEAWNAELPPITAFSSHALIAFLPEAKDAFAAHEELGTAYRYFRGQPGELRGAAKIPLGLPLKGIDEANRRASPLLMHIHQFGDRFVPSVLFLPATFHPDKPDSDRIEFFAVAQQWMNELKGGSL